MGRRAGTGLILLTKPMIYALIGLIPTRTAVPVAWALALTALVVAGLVIAWVLLMAVRRLKVDQKNAGDATGPSDGTPDR